MLFCRDYSKIHLYNQFKIEHVFQTKAAIKIFEDCDVEPILFVFKHSNLIGHYRYSLKVSRFMRFISNMHSLFKGLSKFIAHNLGFTHFENQVLI